MGPPRSSPSLRGRHRNRAHVGLGRSCANSISREHTGRHMKDQPAGLLIQQRNLSASPKTKTKRSEQAHTETDIDLVQGSQQLTTIQTA